MQPQSVTYACGLTKSFSSHAPAQIARQAKKSADDLLREAGRGHVAPRTVLKILADLKADFDLAHKSVLSEAENCRSAAAHLAGNPISPSTSLAHAVADLSDCVDAFEKSGSTRAQEAARSIADSARRQLERAAETLEHRAAEDAFLLEEGVRKMRGTLVASLAHAGIIDLTTDDLIPHLSHWVIPKGLKIGSPRDDPALPPRHPDRVAQVVRGMAQRELAKADAMREKAARKPPPPPPTLEEQITAEFARLS